MFKILLSLLFVFVAFTYAAEDKYVFEAKGEFAKELKALVEKYSKEGKIDAKVYKRDDSIVSSILGSGSYDIDGKKLYEKKCASCHGMNGEVGAGAGSRILKDIPKEDMITAIYAYQNDMHYGGALKSLMQPSVVGLSEKKIISIYNYLHGVGNEKKSTKVEEKIEEKSSYLQ
ncbi:c-type cytochrome [Sulfurospirillum sp. 1307]